MQMTEEMTSTEARKIRQARLLAFRPANAVAFTLTEDITTARLLVGHLTEACVTDALASGDLPAADFDPAGALPCPYCVLGDRRQGVARSYNLGANGNDLIEVRPDLSPVAEEIRRESEAAEEEAAEREPVETDAEVIAKCEEWLLGLGRKVEVHEVTARPVRGAALWLAAYTGDFEFLLDVRRKARGNLSTGQAKGVLNCWRAELVRNAPKPDAPTAAPAPKAPGSSSDFPEVPEGHYAVTSATGNNDLDFYRVDRPTEGEWAGRVFVKRMIGGHPDMPVRGSEGKLALARILAAGPAEAAVLYGQKIGKCHRCNRSLTDKTSRDLGIGPECRKR